MQAGDLQLEPMEQKTSRFCWGCFFFAECHMSLSALGLRRKDDRKFALTTITAIGAEKNSPRNFG